MAKLDGSNSNRGNTSLGKHYIESGQIVKIWHDFRGHDYVVLGTMEHAPLALVLQKATTIRRDGTPHSSVGYASYMVADILSIGPVKAVDTISRVIGRLPVAINPEVLGNEFVKFKTVGKEDKINLFEFKTTTSKRLIPSNQLSFGL